MGTTVRLRVPRFLGAAALAAAASCSAEADPRRPEGGPPAGEAAPRAPAPGGRAAPAPDPGGAAAMPLRRLTRREYNNTVRDLLMDGSRPADAFPREPFGETGFALPETVSRLDAQLAMEAAEAVAKGAVARLEALLPCEPALVAALVAPVPTARPADEEACARRFVEAFGRRAFRRPVAADEVTELVALWKGLRAETGLDVRGAAAAVVEAMLQSGSFLYHWELGPTPPARQGALVKLTPYQLASRLSYFLWGSMPDEELFAAAAAGRLASTADLLAQARRLLAHEARVVDTMIDFHEQWLHATGLPTAQKAAHLYPDFDRPLAESMRRELATFVSSWAVEGDGRLETLLTHPGTFVNERLARVYGVRGVEGERLRRIDLDPAQRGGVLTLASFLTASAGADGSHPVKRGQIVYEQILCGELPAPPAEVPEPAPPSPNVSTRERFALHANSPCASCHKLFDPLGFAFEHYDAVGKYRATEAGKPVDASGRAPLPGGGELVFSNAPELARGLAASADVRRCVARQWFRYALGRREQEGDAASFARIYDEFVRGGLDVRELLLAIVGSPSFSHRAAAPGEVL